MWTKNLKPFWVLDWQMCVCMSLYLILHTQRCPSIGSPSGLVHQGCYSSHSISPPSPFFSSFLQRHILQNISKQTLENNIALFQSNHLSNCTSRWWAHQSFTLFSPAVILPSFPSCLQAGNMFLNQNCWIILSAASFSCLQALTNSCLHLGIATLKDSPLKIYTRHFALFAPGFKLTLFLSWFSLHPNCSY